MLTIYDLKVDKSDDIVIKGDIIKESNSLKSIIQCARRRVGARRDDMTYQSSFCAGLESYLCSTLNEWTLSSISDSINHVLTQDNLFSKKDYELRMDVIDNNKLYMQLIFKLPIASYSYEDTSEFQFGIYIDQENQRIYT